MNVNFVERRRRRRRKRRRAKEEEEEEEGFFVYRRDPWTKERVKVNEDGEERSRGVVLLNPRSQISEAIVPVLLLFLFFFFFFVVVVERRMRMTMPTSRAAKNVAKMKKKTKNKTKRFQSMRTTSLTTRHPFDGRHTNTNTNNTSVIEDSRNYCLFRFRWCWKFDSLSWWVAMCFLFAALFLAVGSACSCFKGDETQRCTGELNWFRI